MNWNDHSNLKGRHAIFSPSSYYWIRDDDDEIVKRYCMSYASSVGTILHALAEKYIRFGKTMSRYDKKQVSLELLNAGIPPLVVDFFDTQERFENLMNYVNDSVGWRMDPEVVLYYSDIFFGTCDTIAFDEREKILRINDLKNGSSPASMDQLMQYAALFCLEYGPLLRFRPEDISYELRIYQSGEIQECFPNPDEVVYVIESMKSREAIIRKAGGNRR